MLGTQPIDRPDRRLSRRARHSLLVVHIVAGVGLLGDAAGFLAVVIRGTLTADADLRQAAFELARMLSYVFGIPLSFLALLTGLALGIKGPWSVLRSPWVTAKLVLILTVIGTGALAIDPALEALLAGHAGEERQLIVAGGWQVLALLIATTLSVFKPGGRGRAPHPGPTRPRSSEVEAEPESS